MKAIRCSCKWLRVVLPNEANTILCKDRCLEWDKSLLRISSLLISAGTYLMASKWKKKQIHISMWSCHEQVWLWSFVHQHFGWTWFWRRSSLHIMISRCRTFSHRSMFFTNEHAQSRITNTNMIASISINQSIKSATRMAICFWLCYNGL